MRELLIVLFLGIVVIGCHHYGSNENNAPCREDILKMLPSNTNYYKDWLEYPETIIVAFTRNGKIEDSVEAVRWDMLMDCSPSYVFTAGVGDTWVYDVNGNFLEFNCSPFPHSGQGHHNYKP